MVGRHWAPDCEIDVVAIQWPQRKLLLGECKWGAQDVGLDVVRSLIEERSPRVLARLEGEQWDVHFVFFARSGFTEAARHYATTVGARLLTLEAIDADLKKVKMLL
jgi:uncharacterized protein